MNTKTSVISQEQLDAQFSYCDKMLIPFLERQKYVPEMIRAHEERVRPSA